MKDYFLAFDFYNESISKFYYGIVRIDFRSQQLTQVAKQKIKETYPTISPDEVTIRITALNNIEI